MHEIDLIIPIYLKSPIHEYFPTKLYKYNPDWYPVYYNLNLLKKQGVKIRFLNCLNLNLERLSKMVGVDYKIIRNLRYIYDKNNYSGHDLLIKFLERIKKHSNYLVLFDNKDDTHIRFEFMPYVEKYLKKQLLKERELYAKKLAHNRIYVDYYQNRYQKKKTTSNDPALNNLFEKYKNKIDLSWNIAYTDYRLFNTLLNLLYIFSKRLNSILFSRKLKLWMNSNLSFSDRKKIFSANFRLTESKTVSYQRIEMYNFLEKTYGPNPNAVIGLLPKKRYLKTLQSTKAVFSPFGMGEICHRDFEAFLFRAALIKPNMDPIETWPDLYAKYKTYFPLSWEQEKWEKEISNILNDKSLLKSIAANGQKAYYELWSKEGCKIFCKHFINIVIPNVDN